MQRDGATDEQLSYRPPTISYENMQAIEEAIKQSPEATDFGKRVIIWMLRKTENLTCGVALSIPENAYPCPSKEELRISTSGLCRDNGPTHLNSVLEELGTKVGLSHHGRCFKDGKLNKENTDGMTIWFSYFAYDQLKPKVLDLPSLAELRSIDLW